MDNQIPNGNSSSQFMGGNFVSESIDEEKLRMKERASDFMALPET
jgi:hypothetical protein